MLVHRDLKVCQGVDNALRSIDRGLASSAVLRLLHHDPESSGKLLMLTYQLINDCVERGLGLTEGGEEVVVLGMVMFIEQLCVGVESLKKLVEGFVVTDRRHRQAQAIRVKAVELVVRRLERCDDSALSGERDEILEYRIRAIVR
jgi:hypothetical protein